MSFWFPPPGPSSLLLSAFLSVQAVFQSDEYGLPVRHGGSEEPCPQTTRELDFPLLLKNQPAITPNITEKQQISRSFRAWRGRIKLLIPWNLRDLNVQIIIPLFSDLIVWCKSISRWLPFLNMMELDGILHILLKYLKTCPHTWTAISFCRNHNCCDHSQILFCRFLWVTTFFLYHRSKCTSTHYSVMIVTGQGLSINLLILSGFAKFLFTQMHTFFPVKQGEETVSTQNYKSKCWHHE